MEDTGEFNPIDTDWYMEEFRKNKDRYAVGFAKYTEIPKEMIVRYNELMLSFESSDRSSESRDNPTIFAYYYLGKSLRLHQFYMMELFCELLKKGGIRLAMCLARQLGKSVELMILDLWLCWYNKFPTTISKITSSYVTSRDDDTAKEFVEKLRLILYDGDKHMAKFQEDQFFFTGSLKEPNNTQQVTFINNCFLKSIPPTMKGIGKSASFFIIDEAHRLNSTDVDPDTFYDYSSAIVAETGGGICLSSSPQGQIGFFYDAIDPQRERSDNEFTTIWFPFFVWNDGTEKCMKYHEFVEKKRKEAERRGRLKYWQQEYLALFTVTETSFFEIKDIEDGIEDMPQYYEWKETPCSVGYDYGMKITRTVITVRTKINGIAKQLFQYRCSADFDINNLINPEWEHSIQKLKQRYSLFMIIGDDCPQGDSTNRWFEQNSGLQVKKYNFRSDQMSKTDGLNRNCVAYSYRSCLKSGKLTIPKWNTIQQFEMKIVQETEQKVLISIKAPVGQLCDTFDSDMMACIPFLDMQTMTDYSFSSDEIQTSSMPVDKNHPRYDEGIKQFSEKELKDIMAKGELWRLSV